MTTSDMIAGAALVLSITGFLYNRRDIRRQIELQERQIIGDEAARRQQMRAHLHAEAAGVAGGDPTDTHRFKISNAGPANAREASAWIAGPDGQPISNPQRLGPLKATDDHPVDFTLAILVEFSRGTDPCHLRVSWVDGEGRHEEDLLQLTRFG